MSKTPQGSYPEQGYSTLLQQTHFSATPQPSWKISCDAQGPYDVTPPLKSDAASGVSSSGYSILQPQRTHLDGGYVFPQPSAKISDDALEACGVTPPLIIDATSGVSSSILVKPQRYNYNNIYYTEQWPAQHDVNSSTKVEHLTFKSSINATPAIKLVPQEVPDMYHSMTPTGQYPTQQYPVGYYSAQAPPPNVAPTSFDPGARFNAGATVNIPPPPPGYAPNSAQAAAAQGQNVHVQQRQAGWFSGGTDGGYTFW